MSDRASAAGGNELVDATAAATELELVARCPSGRSESSTTAVASRWRPALEVPVLWSETRFSPTRGRAGGVEIVW